MWQGCSRDFFGLQFLIQGFSWEGKFGKYFIRGLDLSRVFWECSFNNLNILDSPCISWPRSSANKVQPSKVQGVGVNYLCFLEIFKSQKFAMWFFLWLIFGPGIFWVLLEALGIFWVSNFAPIQSSLSLEIQSTPWGYIVFVCFYFSLYQSLWIEL